MDFKTDFKPLTVDPDKIYDYSFSIIAEEMGNHDFSEDEWKIVRGSFMLQRILNWEEVSSSTQMPFKLVWKPFAKEGMSLLMCK